MRDRPRLILTEEQIEAGKTEKGGYTRDQLAEWGVPWPPPKGWIEALINGQKVGQHETSCMVTMTLTGERMNKLRAAADMTAIEPNHYALIMLGKMIDRGEFLEPEDWWQGTERDLEKFKREFGNN